MRGGCACLNFSKTFHSLLPAALRPSWVVSLDRGATRWVKDWFIYLLLGEWCSVETGWQKIPWSLHSWRFPRHDHPKPWVTRSKFGLALLWAGDWTGNLLRSLQAWTCMKWDLLCLSQIGLYGFPRLNTLRNAGCLTPIKCWSQAVFLILSSDNVQCNSAWAVLNSCLKLIMANFPPAHTCFISFHAYTVNKWSSCKGLSS